MSTIIVLTPSDADNGFACAGAIHSPVPPGQGVAMLQQALAADEGAVVILDERLLAEIGEERLQELEEGGRGVLVVLPSPVSQAPAEDYATRLIRRAIGYQVKVQR